MTSIELLSPARNLETGIAAIDHGADAVYIGADRFGARSAAGNGTEDIARLCDYAHRYGAKVYATVNTILYEHELQAARQLICDLYEAHTDALIVQDMALLQMDLPPIELHASTQMDNRTAGKAKWLSQLGFKQMVLARELSLQEIEAVHRAVPDMTLEAFCHGALCVSYSGQCYASQYCFGRSANRGACAQFCRLPFSLQDAGGNTLIRDKYLLSLRDMNRIAHLEAMMDAGVRSFKIEGRLKDIGYVKNVTACYRKALDSIMARRSEYGRASLGTSSYTFQPDLTRSFSRGGTDYFLHGRTADLDSPDTPKSRGREVGRVKDIRRGCVIVASSEAFSNGDGLCFIGADGKLQGFRVNRADGNHLYPAAMPEVRVGDRLWRSFDQRWEKAMEGKTAERRIGARFLLEEVPKGFRLTLTQENGQARQQVFPAEHVPAKTDQSASIRDVLGKLGDTPFTCTDVEVRFSQPWFIPRSQLTEWRREISSQDIQDVSLPRATQSTGLQPNHNMQGLGQVPAVQEGRADFRLNIANSLSGDFYAKCGCPPTEPAMEVRMPEGELPLMRCRFCLRYAWGWCKKQKNAAQAPKDPLYLVSADGRRFRLSFDCKACEMTVMNCVR